MAQKPGWPWGITIPLPPRALEALSKMGRSDTGMFGNAEAYERFMGRWSRLIAADFLDFAALGADSRVLDLGCGTGALAQSIAARCPTSRVVGIDPSAEYIACAAAAAGTERLSFAVGAAQSLPFEADSFDAAVSLLVFNFIPAPQQALSELRRVVCPGGEIAAAVWDYGEAMQMLRIFWDAATALEPGAAVHDEKHMPLCLAGELQALWDSAGLSAVTEQGLEKAACFASFNDFWSPFLLGQGPAGAYVRSLPAAGVVALREELARRLPPAPFTLRARAWAVRGRN